jgi:hypothetical protein
MPYPSTAEFGAASFLIYSQFMTASKVGGSLLLDCALTETEAQEKKCMYEQRAADFDAKFPLLRDGTSSIVYINNRAHWWPTVMCQS